MAQQSAALMGAERVIGIDRFPERLRMALEEAGSETIDYTAVDSVVDVLKAKTGSRGPDACINAVGMEAHGTGIVHAYDRVKQSMVRNSRQPLQKTHQGPNRAVQRV